MEAKTETELTNIDLEAEELQGHVKHPRDYRGGETLEEGFQKLDALLDEMSAVVAKLRRAV